MDEWFVLKIWKGVGKIYFLHLSGDVTVWVSDRKLASPLKIDWIGKNIGYIYLMEKPESIEILLIKGKDYE